MQIEYALYKGDNLLSIGTIKEISQELNIKESTVFFYQTPTYKKRTKDVNAKRLVKL